MQLIVLGRQPELSLAELEALFGSDSVELIGHDTARLKDTADIGRLGGAIKIGQIVHSTRRKSFSDLAQELAGLVEPQKTKYNFGISWHGGSTSETRKLALEVKKLLKKNGHKLRAVLNTDSSTLSTAQVWHNRLDKEPNTELILSTKSSQITVAKTIGIQNVEAYAARDHGRSARDARVGMLPPKLAQIMVNLAGLKQGRILDPFCGTGVVLQEAARIGYPIYGTDISSRMVEYSRQNLLEQGLEAALETADARNHTWQPPVDGVVSETYLGPPLSAAPSLDRIRDLAEESGQLMAEFLKNIAPQLKSGAPLVLAVPAWFSGKNISHSTVVDQIERLGYTRRSFKTVKNQELIYRRPGQVVGRELLVLTRN